MPERDRGIVEVCRAMRFHAGEPLDSYLIAKVIDRYKALPVVVTDEMVERTWWAMGRAENLARRSMGVNKTTVRAVLEAALNPQQ